MCTGEGNIEFKPGDRVKIKNSNIYYVSDTGTVVERDNRINPEFVSVRIDNYSGYHEYWESHAYLKEQLILLEKGRTSFSIGDRVAVSSYFDSQYGKRGTVADVREKNGVVIVQLDGYKGYYKHDADGHIFNEKDLHKLEINTGSGADPIKSAQHLKQLANEYCETLESVYTYQKRAQDLKEEIDRLLLSSVFDIRT